LTSALKEALCSGTEFWDSGKTLKTLAEEDYFKCQGETKWPDVLKSMLSESKLFFLLIVVYEFYLICGPQG
jgi:hypothetical protein